MRECFEVLLFYSPGSLSDLRYLRFQLFGLTFHLHLLKLLPFACDTGFLSVTNGLAVVGVVHLELFCHGLYLLVRLFGIVHFSQLVLQILRGILKLVINVLNCKRIRN